MRAIVFGFFLILGLQTGAKAQVDCQGIMNQLLSGMGGPGVYSGGAGDLANIYNTYCHGGQRQQNPQQQVGDYCSNGGTCPVGTRCSQFSNTCVPDGMVDCGSYSCQPGNKCSSGGTCIAQDTLDCGRGLYCQGGAVCWTARGDWPGTIRRGQMSCATPEQASTWDSKIAEIEQERRQRIAEERAAKRRAEEERREARRRAEQERREAARQKEIERRAEIERKKAEATEARGRQLAAKKQQKEEANRKAEELRQAARAKEEERKTAIERTRREAAEAKERAERARLLAAEVEAKRKAEAEADRKLLAIMHSPKESIAMRKIAAIALGRDPDTIGGPSNVAADKEKKRLPTKAERELTAIAMGKLKLQSTYTQPQSSDDMLRAVLNNSRESLDARKIAVIGLGLDPASVKSVENTPASSSQIVAPSAKPEPYLRAGQQAIDNAFSPDAQKALDANPNKKPEPYLRAGQQAIDNAFSPEAQKALDANPNKKPEPYLRAGQQAIDSAFASPNGAGNPSVTASPTATERKLAEVAIGSGLAPANTGAPAKMQPTEDQRLRNVMADTSQPIANRKLAAIALGLDPATIDPVSAKPIEIGKAVVIGTPISIGAPANTGGPQQPTGTFSAKQIQFLRDNSVTLSALTSPAQASPKAGASMTTAPSSPVTGFNRTIPKADDSNLLDRLSRGVKFANDSVKTDANFKEVIKGIVITGAAAGTGCIIGAGVGLLAGGVTAIPGCAVGASYATAVYGGVDIGVALAKGVNDIGDKQYGSAAARAAQTAADQFADATPSLPGVSSTLKAGGSWGTYFIYGFYTDVPQ